MSNKRKTVLNNPLSKIHYSSGSNQNALDGDQLLIQRPTKKSPRNNIQKVNKTDSKVQDVNTEDIEVIKRIFNDGVVSHSDVAETSSDIKNNKAQVLSAEEILSKESSYQIVDIGDQLKGNIPKRVAVIINRWAWISVPVGFIPIPLIDTATLMGVQIKLISELCDHYKIPFEKESAKAILLSLLGGGFASVASSGVKRMIIKNLPHIGNLLSAVTEPTVNFASTYAIGHVFAQHFENNGVLQDFNYERVRDTFSILLEKGKSSFKSNSAN